MLPSDSSSSRLPFHLHTVNELESVHYDSLLSLESEKDEHEILSPVVAQRSPTASPPGSKLDKVLLSLINASDHIFILATVLENLFLQRVLCFYFLGQPPSYIQFVPRMSIHACF
jgi:hypothetical protein